MLAWSQHQSSPWGAAREGEASEMDFLDVDIESHRQVRVAKPLQTAWVDLGGDHQGTFLLEVASGTPVRVYQSADPRT